MAKNAFENIESLVRGKSDLPFDGWVVSVYPGHVTVQMARTNRVKRNVAIPKHIDPNDITLGVAVKMTEHQGRVTLVSIFPGLAELPNYAGRGTTVPDPAQLGVVATAEGWLVTWPPVAGADRYRVYRNDTADETSPDDLGITTQTRMLVPYEDAYRYFAVRSYSGLKESELSAWVTDNVPPEVPDTFDADDTLDGHTLIFSGADVSMNHLGFKCWEIEMADDGQGTNALSLGQFYPIDIPIFRAYQNGIVKWYRARAIDYAGNASGWTAWDAAYSVRGTFQDRFDTYGGDQIKNVENLYWLKVANANTDENWVSPTFTAQSPYNPAVAAPAEYTIEGDRAITITSYGMAGDNIILDAFWDYPVTIDLSQDQRFGPNDYVSLSVYVDDPQSVTNYVYLYIIFQTATQPGGPQVGVTPHLLKNQWNHLLIKKSNFQPLLGGSPDWARVDNLQIWLLTQTSSATKFKVYIDDIRIVKANVADPTTTDDMGGSWLYSESLVANTKGIWHIYPGNRSGEPGKPFSLGQIRRNTAASNAYHLAYKSPTELDIADGTLQAGIYFKHSQDAAAGLAFFIKDTTPGNWTMYLLHAVRTSSIIRLSKFVNGTMTTIQDKPFTLAAGQTLWLGVDFREFESDNGRLKVYASLNEGNLIQANNLVMSLQDTSIERGGTIGLAARLDSNVRFVNVIAGSPDHADVADVAKALDGPILAGANRRVRFNRDANIFQYSDDGVSWFGTDHAQLAANNVFSNTQTIRGVSPTINFRDTDQRSAFIHINSGLFYVLRGAGVDSGSWEAYGGQWPLTINLENNDISVGGGLYRKGYEVMSEGTKVARINDLAISPTDWSIVTFETAYTEQPGWADWDTASAIYATKSGLYLAIGQTLINPNGSNMDNVAVGFWVNGVMADDLDQLRNLQSRAINLQASGVFRLAAGNYVQMGILATAGGAPYVTGYRTRLSLIYLGQGA